MKLVITEPSHFSEEALLILKANFEVVKLEKTTDIEKHIEDVEVLFIRLGIHFFNELLTKAKKLRIICTPTTGLDHIDQDYCHKNKIKLISLKGEFDFLGTIPSTAEHAFTLLTSVNRYINLAARQTQNKIWDRNQFKSYNLRHKTLGIVGLGRVGKQVANYALAFGMRVVAYDVNPDQKLNDVENYESAEQVFKVSDFISIHIPLETFNVKFINDDLIDLMKPTSCIINTSRGQVWDEAAIVKALKTRKIRGVATDVVFEEVSDDIFESPIFKVNTQKYNCIITPHIAGATFDSMQMTELYIAKKLMIYI